MKAAHLAFFVEDASTGVFLETWLRRFLPADCDYAIHAHHGKQDLLAKLAARLDGYHRWLPETHRLFVVVDRDQEPCAPLKARIEAIAAAVGLSTRATAGSRWQVSNRIAIEELEAWYFGDWEAVRAAFPRVDANLPMQRAFREPDAIRGGTWEAFERALRDAGYFRNGLEKREAARAVGAHFDPTRCRSPSFQALFGAIQEAVA
jgi:hypothetical protein